MFRSVFFPLLVSAAIALGASFAASPSRADTAPTPAPSSPAPLTAEEARRALDVVADDNKRAQLIETLKTIAAAAPASPSKASTTNSPTAAFLLRMSQRLEQLSVSVGGAFAAATDLALLWHQGLDLLRSPDARAPLADAAWKLALVLAAGLAAERTVGRLVAHRLVVRRGQSPAASAAPRPWRWIRRLPAALARLALALMPVAVFLAVGHLLLGLLVDTAETTRLAIVGFLYAYALWRCVSSAAATLLAPETSERRLIPVDARSAGTIERWVRLIAAVALFGTTLADVARLSGVSPPVHEALLKLVMLATHGLLLVAVFKARRPVAEWIRGKRRRGVLAQLRNRAGDLWHYLAAVIIAGLWVVWAFGLEDGYARLLQVSIATIAVLAGARLAIVLSLSGLERWLSSLLETDTRSPWVEKWAGRYYPPLRSAIVVVLGFASFTILLEAWGLDALAWFQGGAMGERFLSAGVTIGITLVIAAITWEGAAVGLERTLKRLSDQGDHARSARLRTLLPMLKTGLLVVIMVVVCLTVLSVIGINIGPLLASAGILGIAIGFGSQKLVQDLITGLFLLIEDAMEVGDTVTVSGLSGTVERLSIRTIRLRAGDGSVHIIPFSAVTSVTNTNRGIGNAAISVTVSLAEDTDRVGKVMADIALEMRRDALFQDKMRSDLQLWGVDRLDGSSATLVGQIVCTDTGRWDVQREYNRRLKIRFQELGIEIATPTHAVILRRGDNP